MSQKPYDIRERSFLFATIVLEIASQLPATRDADVVRTQVIKSGTSVGANIEEADGGLTKPDKRKSFVIARKETRETRYWLRIIQNRWGKSIKVDAEIAEASEIIMILSAIIDKLR